MGQIRSRLHSPVQHDQGQVAVALRVRLNLRRHDERRAHLSARKRGDEAVAHVTGLQAEEAPLVRRLRQLLQASEEPHVRGQLVVDAAERDRAGGEAEGLADGAVAAHADVDRVEGGVDDVDLARVHLGRSAQEVFHVAFVPGGFSASCDQLGDMREGTEMGLQGGLTRRR